MVKASIWSWVTNTVVMASRCWISRISTRSSSRRRASRFESGSSSSRTLGCTTSARANATRCCWPPDSSAGIRLPRPGRRTMSSACSTRSRTSRAGTGSHLESERDVGVHGEMRKQRVLLKHHADVAPVRWKAGDVGGVDANGSRRHGHESGDHAQHRGLAAPGRPEQAEHRAGRDVEAQVVHGGRRVPEPFGDAFEGEGCGAPGHRLAGMIVRRHGSRIRSRISPTLSQSTGIKRWRWVSSSRGMRRRVPSSSCTVVLVGA